MRLFGATCMEECMPQGNLAVEAPPWTGADIHRWRIQVHECIREWSRITWSDLESDADVVQEIAKREARVVALERLSQPQKDILVAALISIALACTGEESAIISRRTRIQISMRCLRLYVSLGEIGIEYRRVLHEALLRSGCDVMPQYIGAIAFSRLKWAVEELGYRFIVATGLEDAVYGIDGWIEIERRNVVIPVQVKSSRGTHRSSFWVVTPDTELPPESRMGYAWPYLEGGGLKPRILYVAVDSYETARRCAARGDLSAIEESIELMGVVARAIRAMES